MKKVLLALFLFTTAAFAQVQTTAPVTKVTLSGTVINMPNYYLATVTSFDESFAGTAPTTASITIQGCVRSNTCDSVVDTNTSTSAVIRKVTFTGLYTYFNITVTWTGGDATTIFTINPAFNGSAKSGGTTTAAGVVALFTGCSGVQYLGADGACHVVSGGGTVTSVGLLGTASQLTVTGASPITGSGSWTISIPSALVIPGTINGLTPTSLATGYTLAGGTASRTLTVDATVSTSALAPLASPALTGVPTVPTAAVSTSTTQAASTAFVLAQAAAPGAIGGTTPAAGTFTTLTANTSLVINAGTALTTTNQTGTGSIALAVSPALTGTPTGPTAAANTNTTQLATTAFVIGQGYAPLASPALTGVPTVPTAAVSTNTTQAASTAFVLAQAAAPGTIGGTTPAAGTFTTLTANTSLVINAGTALATTNQTGTGSLVLAASPTLTGVPLAPTAIAGTNTTQLATTAFVTTAVGGGGAVTSVFTRTGAVVATSGDYAVAQVTGAAPLASPALTGVPTVPTATVSTNTTQAASTAFVLANTVNSITTTSPITGSGLTPTIACATCTTSASALTSNAVVLGGGGQATKVAGGIVTDGTSVLTLGVAGASVGSIALNNATSGTLTLAPPTGALGTVTVTVPAAADTLVNLTGVQTLTNKSIAASEVNSGTLAVAQVPFNAPGAIGGTTSAAGTFTTLTANTSLVINAGTALTTTNQTGTGNLVLATSPSIATATLTGQTTIPVGTCVSGSSSFGIAGALTYGLTGISTTKMGMCAGGNPVAGWGPAGITLAKNSTIQFSNSNNSITTLENTNLVRDDLSIWCAAAGGTCDGWFSGSQGYKVVTGADVTSTTTTNPPTTTLFTITMPPTTAAKTYSWGCKIYYQGSATSMGLLAGVNSSVAPTSMLHHARAFSTLTGTSTDASVTSTTSGSILTLSGVNVGTANTTMEADLDGTIEEPVAGGTLIIDYNASATGTLTIKRGSYCTATVN